MATRTTKPTKPTASTEPAACKPCGRTGNVPTTVRVGRKRRPVGQQDGLCLNCLGSGTDPNT
ncbi:hypothetical protein ABZ736_28860 [Streptomyces sp. NPDC013099]|uniref:hypothetical protein n=1 Tax=unclassified Streptomyces TaxID=2593676 RepID=UPI0033C66583